MAEKIRLPSSQGGLVSYGDDEVKSKLMLKPEVVVVLCVAVIIIGIALSVLGAKLF